MQDKTLVKISVTKHGLTFRTISRRRKSPQVFYILRETLEELENLLNPAVTVSDIHSYAELRRSISRETVQIRFCWLSGCENRLAGWAETVTIPYAPLIRLARRGTEGEVWSVLSMGTAAAPKLLFHAGRNLQAVAADPVVRHKLARCLRENFQWPQAESIHFYDDFLPYSFSFREIREGQPGICGGLILHGQESKQKAYYSVHT